MMDRIQRAKRCAVIAKEVDAITAKIEVKERILDNGRPGDGFYAVVGDLNALRAKRAAKLDEIKRLEHTGEPVVMDEPQTPLRWRS